MMMVMVISIHVVIFRSTLELDKQQWRMLNPKFDLRLREVVASISAQLGLDANNINIKPHKLLLYRQ